MCPCEGKRSVNWHTNNKVAICQASRDRKNAGARAKAASRRKPVEEVQEDCVCKGAKNESWHRYNKVKPCLAARKGRRAVETDGLQILYVRGKKIRIKWVPGTSIHVPEFDPL